MCPVFLLNVRMRHMISVLTGYNLNTHNMTLLQKVLYTNNDLTLVNSLHRRLNCNTGGLDYHVSTAEYRTRVHCIHM